MSKFNKFNDNNFDNPITIGEKINREFLHLKLLLKKNFLVSIRSYFSTGIEILSPLAFIIVLFLIAHFSGNDNPLINYEQNLPQCISKGENRCFNLMYSPINSTSVNEIIKVLSSMNGNMKIYSYPNDTGLLPDMENTMGLKGGIIGMNSVDDISAFVLKHPNVTVAAIDFNSIPYNFMINGQVQTNDTLVIGNTSTTLGFNVMVNQSNNNPLIPPVDYSIQITSAIQNAIIQHYANNGQDQTNIPFNFTFNSNEFTKYPVPQTTAQTWGGLFYYCGSMITFIFLLYKVSFEKENKLKQGMIMMGLSSNMYYVSWFVTSFSIDLLVTLITIAIGAICQLQFFINTNFLVLLMAFFFFTIAMSAVAFFLLSFIQTTKTAIGIGMAIFIVGAIFQLIFSSIGSLIFQLIYQTDSNGALAARIILFFIPMFHFTKVLTDIGNIVKNTHFTLKDLTINLNSASGFDTVVPTTAQSCGYMIALTVIYTALAWYFEHIIPGNDGTSYPPWFFILPSYWGFSSKRIKHIPVPIFEDEDIRSAINKAHDPSNNAPFIIRGLSKVYTKFLRPNKSVHAVKYLSLSVEQGTILGFLGSNGAGKSTTIGILTGLLEPTSGDAYVYGHSIVNDIAEVRKITSVVPQHDILWAELSAFEHLQLFAELKGIPEKERAPQIQKVLEQVRLARISNNPISTYSGGMKRRLSVAIACIGNPKIIFMDECTTGMDPASKRHIYTLIKEIKKDKVIILTSHDMFEVEMLADEIVIMAEGVMACTGNALQLKNKFGEGYSINIVSQTLDSVSAVVDFVTRSIPGCKFMKQSALQLNFGFPVNTDPKIIINFFKKLDEITKDDNNQLLRDWSISHSNLDDVFLKVSYLSKLKTQ